MLDLATLLEDPEVEIVESSGEFSPAEVERVRAGKNRAAAGIVRDGERVLLQRRAGEDWRLPGTDVGHVVAFEEALRESLQDRLGIESATVAPNRVHQHSATDADDVPPYYYVLFDVEPAVPPASEITSSPEESIEVGWFSETPAAVVNPGVMEHLFAAGSGSG